MTDLRERVLGCVVGASIGDALGGPFEFQDAAFVRERVGGEWIDDLHPYRGIAPSPHGTWSEDPPAGTGTDDTRYNHLFLEAVLEHGPGIDARQLAEALLRAHDEVARLYPSGHALAREQLADWQGVCCGFLGRESPRHPGVPPEVLAGTGLTMDYPTLIGMLLLASAGLLHVGDAEAAYRHAYRLDFVDLGYAREAVGMLAGLVALLAAGEAVADAVDAAIQLNPFSLGGPFGGPTMLQSLPRARRLARYASDDRDLVQRLAAAYSAGDPFDPREHLGAVVAALLFTGGDARRCLPIAANLRNVDPDGALLRLRDIDCSAYFAGAAAGAHCGIDGLPADWVQAVVEANREAYGIDLLGTAEQLFERIRS